MFKFKPDDRVYDLRFEEYGTILKIEMQDKYPICVKFDGKGATIRYPMDLALQFLENVPPKETQITELAKLHKDNPINPDHYRAKGIPEAIDIMRGLMTDEQLEGFLWGNIIKYAYRYGRKGDTQGAKTETAAKIKWYADAMIGYLSGH